MYHEKTVVTPVGKLRLVATKEALCAVLWEKDDPSRVKLGEVKKTSHHPILENSEKQLLEYFRRTRRSFDLKLEFKGTEFQRKVWKALRAIPYGTTVSYRELAIRIGSPRAYRAVGAANGRNPISVIVPCHRVIGANGKLTGFAGGLKNKGKLLKLEASPL